MTRSRFWLIIAFFTLPTLTMGAICVLWKQQLIGQQGLLVLTVITIVSFLYVAFKLLTPQSYEQRE